MNRARGARNSRPRSGVNRSVANRLRADNRAQNSGNVVRGRPDPNSFTAYPWWSLIVVYKLPAVKPNTEILITTTALNNYMKTVLFIDPVITDAVYRISRVDVWNQTPGHSITLLPADWTKNIQLTRIDDTPGLNHYSHVHFIYPKSISATPIKQSDTTSIGNILTTTETGDNKLEIRIHLLWKPTLIPSAARELNTHLLGLPSLEDLEIDDSTNVTGTILGAS